MSHARRQAYTPGLDDQQVVSHLFVERPRRFVLDYRAALLQATTPAATSLPVRVGSPGDLRSASLLQSMQEDKGLVAAAGRGVRNSATGTSPLVLHFNGGAKLRNGRGGSPMDTFRELLLRGRCLPADASLPTPAGPLPFSKLCPRFKRSLPVCK
jgi:hypothetical protein